MWSLSGKEKKVDHLVRDLRMALSLQGAGMHNCMPFLGGPQVAGLDARWNEGDGFFAFGSMNDDEQV